MTQGKSLFLYFARSLGGAILNNSIMSAYILSLREHFR